MAVPTISGVTPALGHTGGGTLVRIDGTGFKLPEAPASTGVVPEPPASVRVFLGGTEARLVRVASATRLYVTTERRDPGLVALEVRNVGPHGETIGAETATLADAFTYARPDFTAGMTGLDLVVRALQRELVRQVFPVVVVTAHVDWTDDPGSILRKVASAKVPSVFVAGPTIRENRFYRTSARRTEALEGVDGVVVEHRSARTVDLVFTIGAMADKHRTLLGLTNALEAFLTQNQKLVVPITEGGSDADAVEFEINREGDLSVVSEPDESNLRNVTGTIAIVGVDLLGHPGFENDQATTAHPALDEHPALGVEPGAGS
jgi:hypothetical protein